MLYVRKNNHQFLIRLKIKNLINDVELIMKELNWMNYIYSLNEHVNVSLGLVNPPVNVSLTFYSCISKFFL